MVSREEPRLTLQGLQVLRVFTERLNESLAGSDIRQHTALSSGTLYPILIRFESAGWLKSKWEKVDPSRIGRPRKRLYRITPNGLAKAYEALGSLGEGTLAWV